MEDMYCDDLCLANLLDECTDPDDGALDEDCVMTTFLDSDCDDDCQADLTDRCTDVEGTFDQDCFDGEASYEIYASESMDDDETDVDDSDMEDDADVEDDGTTDDVDPDARLL